MKCEICGKKINWNNSFGRSKFLVCPSCHKRIANVIKNSSDKYPNVTSLDIILEIGFIREEKEL